MKNSLDIESVFFKRSFIVKVLIEKIYILQLSLQYDRVWQLHTRKNFKRSHHLMTTKVVFFNN